MSLRFGPCLTGKTLFTSKPVAHVISESQRLSRCNQCFKQCEDLQRCSACTLMKYCGRACQREDWKIHKTECKYLKHVSPKRPSESVHLFLRLLLIQQQGTIPIQSAAEYTVSFGDLMSHMEEIKNDGKRMEQFAFVCEGLRRCNVPIDSYSVSEMLETFGKMTINSFSICDNEMQPIGTGMYLVASKLDHSCYPNAVVTFQGTSLHVRTTQSFAPGTEARISYIDQLALTCDRKRQLEEQYYFTCTCSMCKDKEIDCQMTGSICPNSSCGGCVFWDERGNPLHCSQCDRADFTQEYCQRRNETMTVLKDSVIKVRQLKKDQRVDDRRVLNLCRESLNDCDGIISRTNFYCVRLNDAAFDACINLQHWPEACKFGEATIEAYRLYYPKFHPSVGIQLMKIGKIYLFMEVMEIAIAFLQQAEENLEVTHGKGSDLFRDLKQL